ncbi:hypothetical protein GCM10020001_110530 [Nonomuraea salmonea]
MKVRLRHVVVIVPGILGSVLCDERGTRVWGGLPEGVRRLLQPGALDIDVPLEPVTLMPTIRLIGKNAGTGIRQSGQTPPERLLEREGRHDRAGRRWWLVRKYPAFFSVRLPRGGSRLPPNTWPGRYGTVSARRSTTGGA